MTSNRTLQMFSQWIDAYNNNFFISFFEMLSNSKEYKFNFNKSQPRNYSMIAITAFNLNFVEFNKPYFIVFVNYT